jgi:hypothetical protein
MQTLYVNAMFETVTPEQTTQFQTLCPESRASWAVVQPPYDTCERAYNNREGKLFTAGPHAGSSWMLGPKVSEGSYDPGVTWILEGQGG